VDSAIVAIHENNKTRDQVTGPRHQEAIADSVMMTIGTNYRSGSAIVATTGSGSKSGQCHGGHPYHRYELQESTVPLWPSTAIADSAMVAIGMIQTTSGNGQCHGGHPGQQQHSTVSTRPSITDSVSVTIGTIKAAAAINLPESQEWETICASQLPREENDRCTNPIRLAGVVVNHTTS
jgi:hypothetical protein